MSDKHKLLLLVYVVLFGAISFGFYKFVGYVNPLWLGFLFLLIQQIYLLPQTYSLYHKLLNLKGNAVLSYIPWVNEVAIFRPLYSKLTMILGIVMIGIVVIVFPTLLGLSFVTNIFSSLFGESFGMNYVFYFILTFIILYVVINIIRGLGFMEIKRYIDKEYAEYFEGYGKVGKSFDGFLYILFLFPVGRTWALFYTVDRLKKMVVYNKLSDIDKAEFVSGGIEA